MAEQPKQQVDDVEGDRVRRVRLRADGQRPLAVNLEETISLTRKLFELRDAARRLGRDPGSRGRCFDPRRSMSRWRI